MRKPLLFMSCLLTSFLFLSCSSASFLSLDSLKEKLNIKDFPSQGDYPQADAIVLSETHHVTVVITSSYDIHTVEHITKVIKLFKNIDDHASVSIPIYSGNRLTDVAARTIKPDGTVIPLTSDDFHTVTGSEQGDVFYSDMKTVKFTFPAVEKNCIVEYQYTVYEDYPFIQDQWDIQSEIPKLQDVYTLTVPVILLTPTDRGGAGWNWHFKMFNCDLQKPTAKLDFGSKVSYTWTRSNVPAFKPDPVMSCYENYLQYVKFAPSDWKTWDDVSEWYYSRFFRPQLVITPAITAKAAELTKGCRTDKEKLEKIFAFAQTIRYVAIELGEGGYKPAKPEKVLQDKYGDCKDKSILLISLLQAVGIKAEPVLLVTADEGITSQDFPSWNFNHMIVKATTSDNTAYWMDPTVDHCPLGVIPYDDEGVNALVLRPDSTSRIETIPTSRCTDNVEDIHMKVAITPSNDADFDISMKFSGQSNYATRSFFSEKTHDDIVKFCKSLVADDYLDAEVVDYSFRNLDNADSDLVFRFRLNVPNVVKSQGNMVFLNIDPFRISGSWSWLARDKRTYDMQFDFPRTVNKTIELSIPKDKYEFSDLPSYSFATIEGLNYWKNYLDEGNGKLQVTEMFEVRSKTIPATNFKAVKAFVEAMRTSASQEIILTAK